MIACEGFGRSLSGRAEQHEWRRRGKREAMGVRQKTIPVQLGERTWQIIDQALGDLVQRQAKAAAVPVMLKKLRSDNVEVVKTRPGPCSVARRAATVSPSSARLLQRRNSGVCRLAANS